MSTLQLVLLQRVMVGVQGDFGLTARATERFPQSLARWRSKRSTQADIALCYSVAYGIRQEIRAAAEAESRQEKKTSVLQTGTEVLRSNSECVGLIDLQVV